MDEAMEEAGHNHDDGSSQVGVVVVAAIRARAQTHTDTDVGLTASRRWAWRLRMHSRIASVRAGRTRTASISKSAKPTRSVDPPSKPCVSAAQHTRVLTWRGWGVRPHSSATPRHAASRASLAPSTPGATRPGPGRRFSHSWQLTLRPALRNRSLRACPSCRHSHDISLYLASKPVDLGDQCVLFDKYGRYAAVGVRYPDRPLLIHCSPKGPVLGLSRRCPFGYSCRFLKAHLNADGTLAVRTDAITSYADETSSRISAELQVQLRKHQYEFPRSERVCAELGVPIRKFGKNQNKPAAAAPAAAEPTAPGDPDDVRVPEPLRERKLVRGVVWSVVLRDCNLAHMGSGGRFHASADRLFQQALLGPAHDRGQPAVPPHLQGLWRRHHLRRNGPRRAHRGGKHLRST